MIELDEMCGAVYGWTWFRRIRVYLWTKRYWPVWKFPESAAPDPEISTGTPKYHLWIKRWTSDG